VLRWHVQLGAVPVPKSADPRRQAENLTVFDFALTGDEMAALSALDRGAELATDPHAFGH
jgi:2,5-diketo-D-gluconate reductase A